MIKEDFVSFETAKLLKERGFIETTFSYYLKDGDDLFFDRFSVNWNETEGFISAPMLQMAMKWLREKYNLEIHITYGFPTIDNKTSYKYFWSIVKVCHNYLEYPLQTDKNSSEYQEFIVDTYEEACEEGIKYCLENLVPTISQQPLS